MPKGLRLEVYELRRKSDVPGTDRSWTKWNILCSTTNLESGKTSVHSGGTPKGLALGLAKHENYLDQCVAPGLGDIDGLEVVSANPSKHNRQYTNGCHLYQERTILDLRKIQKIYGEVEKTFLEKNRERTIRRLAITSS